MLAGADGLKAGDKDNASGTIAVSGGTVTVSAYGDAIDAKAAATISGGSFAGAGTSKRPQGFASDGQLSLLFTFPGAEGSVAEVRNEDGDAIGRIESRCAYNYALFSSPELSSGRYRLVCGTLAVTASAN